MTFRFQEGDAVTLKDADGHSRFLPVGSRGVVFCQHMTAPPAYEVNFDDIPGGGLGAVVFEHEIEPTDHTQSR